MWKWLKDNLYFKTDVKKGLRKISGSINSVQALLGTVCEQITDGMEKMNEMSDQVRTVSGKFDSLRSDNDRLFRDIAEELDDLRKDQADEIADLKKHLAGTSPAKGNPETDSDLLKLVKLYRKELLTLEEMLEQDEAWKQQVTLLQEKMRQEEASAGIYAFGKEGERVNLDMHQVAGVAACEDKAWDKTIAHVYEEGFMIRGKIAQKAIVSAYKYGGNGNETGTDYRN